MSGYSSTGQWIVRSGGRSIGPMDGRTPALQLARELRRLGYVAELERLWSPGDVARALEARTRTSELRAQPPEEVDEWPSTTPVGPPEWASSSRLPR